MRCHALVVDDHADSADMLAEALASGTGITVEVAHDGPSALAAVARGEIDVVLLDLGLPGPLDGYDVAKKVRATRRDGVPILIAVTGWAGEEITERALRAGFDRHMVKPIDPYEILRLVTQACHRPGALAGR